MAPPIPVVFDNEIQGKISGSILKRTRWVIYKKAAGLRCLLATTASTA
jgi:hypothetical protein